MSARMGKRRDSRLRRAAIRVLDRECSSLALFAIKPSKMCDQQRIQLTPYPLHLSPICGGERCAYPVWGKFGRHRGAPACVPAGASRLWLQRA
jgi:hypothetical protein